MKMPVTCEYFVPDKQSTKHDFIPCRHFIERENPLTPVRDPGMCNKQLMFLCTEDIKDFPPRLSHSATQDYMRCENYYYRRYIQGLKVREKYVNPSIKLGILYDNLVNKFYDGEYTDIKKLIQLYDINEFDVQRVRAVWYVFKELGLGLNERENCLVQYKDAVKLECDGYDPIYITVVYDRKYPDYFVETKFTKSKRYYDNVWSVQDQVGTYFLGDPTLDKVRVEIVQYPQLRPGKETKKKEAETVDEFFQRCKMAVLSKPADFFTGLDRNKQEFGIWFYRGDFDLDMIRQRYFRKYQQIQRNAREGIWDMNTQNCFMYGAECDYLSLCKNDGEVSEQYFKVRGKKDVYENPSLMEDNNE